MLPRIPEWWIFAIAFIKLGAVFAPCPTMLTPKISGTGSTREIPDDHHGY
jgi:hypothetical protein